MYGGLITYAGFVLPICAVVRTTSFVGRASWPQRAEALAFGRCLIIMHDGKFGAEQNICDTAMTLLEIPPLVNHIGKCFAVASP